MPNDTRQTPNPNSTMLAEAIVGGAGIDLPPDMDVPVGMGAILLYVPLEHMVGKSMPQIQADLGLPWSAGDGQGFWFSDL